MLESNCIQNALTQKAKALCQEQQNLNFLSTSSCHYAFEDGERIPRSDISNNTTSVYYSILNPSLAFVDMDHTVQIWYRCRVDKPFISTQNFYLVQSLGVPRADWGRKCEFQLWGYSLKKWSLMSFMHTFTSITFTYFTCSCQRVEFHYSLVEELGHRHNGFQDIHILQHLYAKVTGYRGRCTLWMHQTWWRDVYEKLFCNYNANCRSS